MVGEGSTRAWLGSNRPVQEWTMSCKRHNLIKEGLQLAGGLGNGPARVKIIGGIITYICSRY